MKAGTIVFSCMLLLLFSGCGSSSGSGGGGQKPSTSAAVSHEQRAAACARLVAAGKRYRRAAGEMGLGVLERSLERRTRGAAERFRREVEAVQRISTSAGDRAITQQLASALGLQEKMFRAFDARRLEEASRVGNQLNTPLTTALSSIGKVCPGAGST
jgi:hypothetical protein